MHISGKTYSVRGSHGIEKTMSVYDENDSALMVRMVTKSPYGILESEEVLSIELFESCLRTGFISEIPSTHPQHALTVA